MFWRARWCLYSSAAALLGLACSSTSATPTQTADSDRSTTRPASADQASRDKAGQRIETETEAPKLDDARIMAITDSANEAEIEQGRLARVRAKDPRVRELAAMMVKHHGQARRDQRQLKVDAEPGADVLNRKRESQRQLEELREKKGTEFDQAYLQLQIAEHRTLLDKLERELMPAAQDDDVKAYLKEIKPRVESHLAEAERLQQKLGATSQRDASDSASGSGSPRPVISNSRGSSARLAAPDQP